MTRMTTDKLNRLRAWKTGVRDGLEQPDDLTMGMSYGDGPEDRRNESYDAGANVGQAIGRFVQRVRALAVRWLP